ncbi:MAG: recombination regulator RecX [Actinomycetia bacterium]|nr:recombination regulator RecX [Actinomycetes bacterium]
MTTVRAPRRLGRDPAGPDPVTAADARAGVPVEADAVEVAREIALRRLDQRACTRAELRAHLVSRGTPEAVADELLARFEQVGLVDDAAFAAAWTASRHGVRHLSRRAVAQELRAKGLDEALIVAQTATIDEDSELAGARALAATKRRALAGLPYAVAYRRLAGVLGRKGYGTGIVVQVVRDSLAAWGAPAGEGAPPEPDL